VVLINIWAFSCLYMGHFVPALNGPCSCPPMGRDLGPNPARYNGPYRAFFVLRAGPPGPAQMYTYSRKRYLEIRLWNVGKEKLENYENSSEVGQRMLAVIIKKRKK
jgi:hypothetical protein